ncbi:MAG: N-formylglutamate amidohydrolase [Aquisalinus sp.]|nr:N-formylglutamate amidohydrolase [Aquisalinus sp.]
MKTGSLFEKIELGDSPFFIICDHAKNWIPDEYDSLGIPDDVLRTHIAWDPGAGDLTRALAQRLSARAVLCGFSRLLIDPNRSTDRHDLIAESSDEIPIPGNRKLSFEQRSHRIEKFFDPYHQAIDCELNAYQARQVKPFVLSIHSFTPRLLGQKQIRPWHIGALWRHDEETARKFMGAVKEFTPFHVGDNQPYNAKEFNYSVDRHVAPRGLKHITIEVRQDLLESSDQVTRMADLLEPIFIQLQEAR